MPDYVKLENKVAYVLENEESAASGDPRSVTLAVWRTFYANRLMNGTARNSLIHILDAVDVFPSVDAVRAVLRARARSERASYRVRLPRGEAWHQKI